MSHRLNPPFRAEHTGSYLRPAELLKKRNEFYAQTCSAEEVKVAEDTAIKNVVKLQQDAGIESVTDGEQRRYAFFDGVFEKMEGITFLPKAPVKEMMTYVPYISQMLAFGITEFPSYYCTGKIKRTRGFYTDDFKYLKSLIPSEDVKYAKVTICPPEWMHLRHGPNKTYDKNVYKNDVEYFSDITQAYREEIEELYSLGCRNIQIDDPTFCFFCSEQMVVGLKKAGVDFDSLLDQYIGIINDCLKGKPADMNAGVHMCRGNFKGTHYCEGGYDLIAAKLFKELNVDCYYLEYDTERAGSFEPLKHLPLHKTVVLGLVSTKNPQVENIDELKRRIYMAADVISRGTPPRSKITALNQICLSPQCGFAAQYEGNPISVEDQKRKLALVVEVANQIWPRGKV